MPTVSLVRCENYGSPELERALARALEALGGMTSFVKPGDRVLLKPNMLSGHPPEKCVTTHPRVIRTIARMVLDNNGRPFIGDSPAIDPFRRVAERTGIADIAEELGLELVELTEPVAVKPPSGALFKNLKIASQAVEADVVINLPKLKTHCQMLLTLGVKNLFGTIVAQRKAEWHHMAGVDRDTFASLLLDIHACVRPALTVLDGVWGMEGHGPSNGTPVKTSLVAASRNAIALDTVVCRTLGVDPRSFPLCRVARAREMKGSDIRDIRLRGDHPQRFDIRGFKVPELDSLDILPGIFDGFTRKYLVSKPVQRSSSCAGCENCVKVCPADAIEIGNRKASFDYDRCIRCYCCQEVCPEDAIHFKKGFLLRVLNRFNR